MALEIRYECLIDESDRNIPKIYRVITDNGSVVSYSTCHFNEVAKASPATVEQYFDLLKEHLKTFADYVDNQTSFNISVYNKMIDMNQTFVYFFTNCPLDYDDETGEAIIQ